MKDYLKELRKHLRKHYCNDFGCLFAGTKVCISTICSNCLLHNCRGCMHLYECFECVEEDEADFI